MPTVESIIKKLRDNNPELTKADLSKSSPSEDNLIELASVLRNNPYLKELNLTSCNIDDRYIISSLAPALLVNKSLKRLILNNNPICSDGEILSAALKSETLVSIQLDKTYLDPYIIEKMYQLMRDKSIKLRVAKNHQMNGQSIEEDDPLIGGRSTDEDAFLISSQSADEDDFFVSSQSTEIESYSITPETELTPQITLSTKDESPPSPKHQKEDFKAQNQPTAIESKNIAIEKKPQPQIALPTEKEKEPSPKQQTKIDPKKNSTSSNSSKNNSQKQSVPKKTNTVIVKAANNQRRGNQRPIQQRKPPSTAKPSIKKDPNNKNYFDILSTLSPTQEFDTPELKQTTLSDVQKTKTPELKQTTLSDVQKTKTPELKQTTLSNAQKPNTQGFKQNRGKKLPQGQQAAVKKSQPVTSAAFSLSAEDFPALVAAPKTKRKKRQQVESANYSQMAKQGKL